jgi:hypothetical protein
MEGRYGGRGKNFPALPGIYVRLVRYQHLVVGNLVGILGTVPFGGISVVTIWRNSFYEEFGGNNNKKSSSSPHA